MKVKVTIFFLIVSVSCFSQKIDTLIAQKDKVNIEMKKQVEQSNQTINDLLSQAQAIVKNDKKDSVKKKPC